MLARLPFAAIILPFLLTVFAQPNPAAAQLKIYIDTDLEGASGVYKFTQTRETDTPLAREAREYFMGDLAAVVRGLRDAGAGEIFACDSHGNQAFIPHLMEPGAKYATGKPKGALVGIDKTYSGLVLVGFHAMMGTADGVLHHTQNSKSENRYWYNGVESGEIAQIAAVAGGHGVPPILVTGDEAVCREAKKFFGDSVVTVAVKRGINREAAVLYPFEETRKALYEGAKKAVAAIPQCKPYRLSLPIKVKKQWLLADPSGGEPKLTTKEGLIEDPLKLLEFQ
jgi:D-amino peptidase